MKTLLLFLFISLGLQAQPEGMVKIDMPITVEVNGDVAHEIVVTDSLTYKVVKRWMHELQTEGVEFQAPLRKIDRIEYVNRDLDYLGEIKKRTIYLNSELHKRPYCKRAAIVQMLFINNGGEVCKCFGTRITAAFRVDDDSEKTFERQYKNGYMFSYTVKALQ